LAPEEERRPSVALFAEHVDEPSGDGRERPKKNSKSDERGGAFGKAPPLFLKSPLKKKDE
jgi:hypothetical protein